MNEKIIEIVLKEDSNYRFLLLAGGYVIAIFYNEKLINPGQAILLRKRIDQEDNGMCEIKCRCVSHNHGRLVLV